MQAAAKSKEARLHEALASANLTSRFGDALGDVEEGGEHGDDSEDDPTAPRTRELTVADLTPHLMAACRGRPAAHQCAEWLSKRGQKCDTALEVVTAILSAGLPLGTKDDKVTRQLLLLHDVEVSAPLRLRAGAACTRGMLFGTTYLFV